MKGDFSSLLLIPLPDSQYGVEVIILEEEMRPIVLWNVLKSLLS